VFPHLTAVMVERAFVAARSVRIVTATRHRRWCAVRCSAGCAGSDQAGRRDRGI
jgi:hypothetical protein